jgi:predicted O-methyltransferase YrrM
MLALDKAAKGVQEGNLWRSNGYSHAKSWHEIQEPRLTEAQRRGKRLELKRRCVLSTAAVALSGEAPHVLEIGFNAGHSAAMFLSVFEKASVTSFDLCLHEYSGGGYELLREEFGRDRVEMLCGDSQETLPRAARERGEMAGGSQVVLVDGGHL